MTNDEKPNILIAIDNFFPVIGGTASVVDQTANALSDIANITVVCIGVKGYEFPKTIKYNILKCKGFYNGITKDGLAFPSLDKNFMKKLNSMKIDAIQCVMAGTFLKFFLKYAKKNNIPVISTIHNSLYLDVKHFIKIDFLSKIITHNFMRLTNKSDYIWTVSKHCAKTCKGFGIKKPIKIVYNATSAKGENQATELEKKEIFFKYNIPHNSFVFLTVSRLIKTKNIDLLIDSVKLLDKKNLNFKVLIAGDGVAKKYFHNKIIKLQVEKYFIFLGQINDREYLEKIYSIADTITIPSYIEAAGLIQVEGSAYNKPSIVIKNSATAEMIEDKINGLTSLPTPKDFSEKMEYAINNPEKMQEIGISARRTLLRNYDDEKIIKELYESYLEDINDYKSKNLDKKQV